MLPVCGLRRGNLTGISRTGRIDVDDGGTRAASLLMRVMVARDRIAGRLRNGRAE